MHESPHQGLHRHHLIWFSKAWYMKQAPNKQVVELLSAFTTISQDIKNNPKWAEDQTTPNYFSIRGSQPLIASPLHPLGYNISASTTKERSHMAAQKKGKELFQCLLSTQKRRPGACPLNAYTLTEQMNMHKTTQGISMLNHMGKTLSTWGVQETETKSLHISRVKWLRTALKSEKLWKFFQNLEKSIMPPPSCVILDKFVNLCLLKWKWVSQHPLHRVVRKKTRKYYSWNA